MIEGCVFSLGALADKLGTMHLFEMAPDLSIEPSLRQPLGSTSDLGSVPALQLVAMVDSILPLFDHESKEEGASCGSMDAPRLVQGVFMVEPNRARPSTEDDATVTARRCLLITSILTILRPKSPWKQRVAAHH